MLNSFACSHRIFDLCLPRISSHNDQNNNNTHILRLLILFTCYYPPMNPIALRSLTRLAGQNATHLCQTRQALKLFSSQAPKAAAGHSKKTEESFSWLAAATALGLGALGLSPLVSQCHCIHCPEPDDDEPEDNTAKPQEIQKEAEDRRLLGASPTKKHLIIFCPLTFQGISRMTLTTLWTTRRQLAKAPDLVSLHTRKISQDYPYNVP